MEEEKIKVSFSISMTKTYSEKDIADWEELTDISGYNLEDVLHKMICEDVLEAMRNGKGCFKIIG